MLGTIGNSIAKINNLIFGIIIYKRCDYLSNINELYKTALCKCVHFILMHFKFSYTGTTDAADASCLGMTSRWMYVEQ